MKKKKEEIHNRKLRLLSNRFKRLLENLASLCHLLFGDGERRDEPQDVKHRGTEKQHIPLDALAHDPRRDLGLLFRIPRSRVRRPALKLWVLELYTDHQPTAADVLDQIAPLSTGRLERSQERKELLRSRSDVFQDLFLAEYLDDCLGGSASHRVTGIGTAHGARLLKVHELLAAGNAGEREAVSDAFGEDQNVGAHAGLFDKEHVTRAAHAGLYFVGDEEDVVLIADFAQTVEEGRGSRHVSAFTEDGLQDDGGGVGGRGLLLQGELDLKKSLVDELFGGCVRGCAAELAVVGECGRKYATHQRPVTFAVDGFGACHRCSGVGPAMVGTLHDDDVWLLRCTASQLHGGFDGFSARIPEKDGVERFVRENRNQFFEERNLRCAEADVDLGVGDLAALRGGGGSDFGMAVAEIDNANAGGHVKKLDALVCGDEGAFTVLEDMLGETSNSLCDVLFTESGRVQI